METQITDAIAWENAKDCDLWVFDKLILSKRLGYRCGPVGVSVPEPGNYIVRPCVNILGMGRGAKYYFIEDQTDNLPVGYFWCEIFTGRHLSVDYLNGEQILSVEGIRNSAELWKFSCWQQVNDEIPLPDMFVPLIQRHRYINVEYIDGNVIEVHLRNNPDFIYGNTVAYPVWNNGEYDMSIDTTKLRYVESTDFHRKGFYID